MLNSSWSKAGWVLLTLGLTVGTFAPLLTLDSTPVNAAPEDTAFPDTQDSWAQPFIQVLAERNILNGYLDGTFRPENPVAREELAAILRQAFDQPTEREIDNGSVFKDVPEDYWASPAIEEAYETGFMSGDPDGFFYPSNSISRAEVLAVLTKKLNFGNTTAAQPTAQPAAEQPTAAQPTAETTTTTQPQQRQATRRALLFPLAMTTLMQPLVRTPVQTQQATVAPPSGVGAPTDPNADVAAAQPAPEAQPAPAAPTATDTVRNYFVDANEIPEFAVDAVAQATQAGVVVNHPDPQVLSPNQPATRADVAAFVHQAMVNQGRLEPIANDAPVNNYIVKGQ